MELKFIFLILLVSLISNIASAGEVKEEDSVLVLTESNIEEQIKIHDHILIEFYAPWCQHCQKLAPEFAVAAKVLRSDKIYLGKIDCSVHKEVTKKYDVGGYPALKLYIKGHAFPYQGGRSHSDIISWVKKKISPASIEYNSPSEIEELIKKSEVLVVFFGDSTHSSFNIYKITAKNYDDIIFVHCGSEECLTHFKANKNSVVIFKKFDEGRNDLPESFSTTQLKSFLEINITRSVMKFDEKTIQIVFGKASHGIFLFRDANADNAKNLDDIFTAVAKQIKSKTRYVIADINDPLEKKLADYIGITEKDLPTIRLCDSRSEIRKYKMEGEITEQNIIKFVENWEQGKLTRYFKSEPVPSTQEGDVVVVVGKSFRNIVMDESKDVLVEFYAPWCGHCKQLAPIYDQLAKKLKHNSNLIIAKIDYTLNEVDQVHIKGFPTLKLFPASKKGRPIDFEGEKSVEGMSKWLEKNVRFPITLSNKSDL